MTDVALHPCRVLSLCAGIGGLDLGLALALPAARTVCYVENDAYACAVLATRMAEKAMDDAPIWTDLRTFDGRPWRGVVDCLVAGFPCQPFSVAGKRRGITDERWLWPDIARIVREVEPRFVFLENVPGLVRYGLAHVLGDLAELGFAAEWGLLSAAAVGAPHIRQRFWLLAHARRGGENGTQHLAGSSGSAAAARGDRAPLANSRGGGRGEGRVEPVVRGGRGAAGGASGDLPLFPPGRDDIAGWADYLALVPDAQPSVRRGADRLADRMDRLRAVGNGVVPLAAAVAFRRLCARLMKV